MIYILIGVVVGLTVGFTGAGGALISIPLFMVFADATLKEATVLSLIAVILGSGVNLYGRLHSLDKSFLIKVITFGSVANLITFYLKAYISEITIALLLSAIAIYSLWAIWQPLRIQTSTKSKDSTVKYLVTGLILGSVTTITGLGGGVLLMPILIRVFSKTYDEALSNSLIAILAVSLFSFLLQMKTGLHSTSALEILYLFIGNLIAFIALKFTIARIDLVTLDRSRRIIFSVVAVYSVGKILFESLGA